VNTIVIENGGAVGHNTDAYGFAESIRDHPLLHAPFTANIIGTGGAAQAAVYVLTRISHLQSLTIYSRTMGRGEEAARRWNDPRVRGNVLPAYIPADLVIHATPIGLAGSPGLPLDPDHLHGSRLLYEMIYSPAETPLMLAARERGIETIGGAAMFIGQALRAFSLWTGVDVDAGDVPENLFRF
jgi:shikimate dehydrogenase